MKYIGDRLSDDAAYFLRKQANYHSYHIMKTLRWETPKDIMLIERGSISVRDQECIDRELDRFTYQYPNYIIGLISFEQKRNDDVIKLIHTIYSRDSIVHTYLQDIESEKLVNLKWENSSIGIY